MPRLATAVSRLLLLAVLFVPTPIQAARDKTAKSGKVDKTDKSDSAAQPAADSSATGAEENVEHVVPPQVIIKSQSPPTYPPAALAARFEGVVVLELTVLKDGTVGDVKVVECTHPAIGFEEAAIEATRKWLFEPAMKEGQPIDHVSKFRMNFRVPGRGQPYVSWGAAGSTSDTGRAESRRDLRPSTSVGTVGK